MSLGRWIYADRAHCGKLQGLTLRRHLSLSRVVGGLDYLRLNFLLLLWSHISILWIQRLDRRKLVKRLLIRI